MYADSDSSTALSGAVIGCAFRVMNTLGIGFLEKVYENALALELIEAGYRVEQQPAISVTYRGTIIGTYHPDLLVEQSIVIELKTVRVLDEAHRMQCINYLKATGLKLCLLLNFGQPKLDIRRISNSA